MTINLGGNDSALTMIYIATNAPAAYDYSRTTEVSTSEGGSRVVTTPNSYLADYQMGRYMSGLYSAKLIAAPADPGFQISNSEGETV